MADWDGLRHDLEAGVSPPPFDALRARHRARKQRRTIAMACAVVLVGGAAGFAVLDRAAQRRDDASLALDQVVRDETVLPPRDYDEYVVTDVDFVSPATGWAIGLRCVGETCDVATFATTNGGTTWTSPTDVARGVPRQSFRAEDPAGGAARSVRMVDERVGYAYNPGLYVTTDGARTWRALPRASKVLSVSVAGDVWITERGCAAGVDCDVVVNAADGDRLAPVPLPATGGARTLVRKSSATHGYLLTWAPASFRFTDDGGASWNDGRMPCPDATAAALSAGPDRPLWLVCTTPDGRHAFTSRDHGLSWTGVTDPPRGGVVTDLVAQDDRTAYLATQTPGHLYVTTDFGRTWGDAPGTARAYGYLNVDAPGAGAAFAMGDAGDLWRTTDGQWSRVALPPGAPAATRPAGPPTTPPAPRGLRDPAVTWTGLWFLDALVGWAVGETCAKGTCRATLRRTADGGDTWREVLAPERTWRADEPPTRLGALTSVAFADERNGWLFGGGSFATHDGGATWVDIPTGYTYDIVPAGDRAWVVSYEGCMSNPCDAYVQSFRAAADPGQHVEEGYATGQLRASVAAYGPKHAYLVDVGPGRRDERLVHTTDGGQRWQERAAPCQGSERDLAAYAPTGLWLLCGGRDADDRQSVLRSADGGATWTTHRLDGRGTGIGEIVPLSDRVAWRTGAHRGLLVTRDGGATWRGDPTIAAPVSALTFADPQHGWLLAGNALWRTTDGATWERLG